MYAHVRSIIIIILKCLLEIIKKRIVRKDSNNLVFIYQDYIKII